MSKAGQRKAFRSGYLACPICQVEMPLELHHINGRKVDRWNEPWNEVTLCPSCHSRISEKPTIRIIGWVQTTEGRQLHWETIK